MRRLKMTVLTFVTLLTAVSRVMTVTGVCHAPGCDDDMTCDVSVTQEDVTTIKVDWSKVWWDLDLECVETMSVSLNGER